MESDISQKRCIRMVVETVSESEIIGRLSDEKSGRAAVSSSKSPEIEPDGETSPRLTVVIGTQNRRLLGDAACLPGLLHAGRSVNLVNCLESDGRLFPELIVIEPDYLVDISLVASIFTDFGAKPLYSIVKRLMPSLAAKHSLLGEFAGQLLDEAAHGLGNRPYSESLADFYRDHCLSLAACEGLGSDFHREARRQKENIRRALSDERSGALAFDAENVVIEPSFVCEMLGLQGRMDFLQNDLRVLIEQKSGKAAFVPGLSPDAPPVASVAHAVQLLLYRALLQYAFDVPEEELRSFLLYSKYSEPLVRTGSSPELLGRAIAVRNALACQDLRLAADGFDFLDTLSPDDLADCRAGGRLWTDFVRPRLAATLDIYRRATPFEQAYCKRMMQFVEREYVRSKLGAPAKKASGVCGRWKATLEEKREAGDIIDGITIETDGTRVVCKTSSAGTSNFRAGDVVTLFQYAADGEPDCRRAIVHRAVIDSIADYEIILRLRAPQRSLASLTAPQGRLWAVEHDFIDSAFGPAYRGLYALLAASSRRREVFLLGKEPATDENAALHGDYGPFNDLQLRIKRARELFLIVGPPGSGKTGFGMLHTLEEELTEPDAGVAVMAYTNRAVDEICDKLLAAGIDFLRIGSEPSCGEPFRRFMLRNRVAGISKLDDLRTFIRSARVMVGTVAAFASRPELFALRGFSLAIVDEASQILEPQIMGIIAAQFEGREAIRKFVFIGDYKQLPAVVRQTSEEAAVSQPVLRNADFIDCRMSLFERLLRKHEGNAAVVATMQCQGRMHRDIARVSNELFYNGLLACVPLPHQTERSAAPRVVFIDVPAPKLAESPPARADNSTNLPDCERGRSQRLPISNQAEADVSDRGSLGEGNVNEDEARAIAAVVATLDSRLSVGIIVPYRNQIAAIRRALERRGIRRPEITIDTVERFQGSQREVIIYGFTVRRKEQLAFLTENSFEENGRVIDRKLNVVITRAMKRLILVGNARLLAAVPLFKTVIENYCAVFAANDTYS